MNRQQPHHRTLNQDRRVRVVTCWVHVTVLRHIPARMRAAGRPGRTPAPSRCRCGVGALVGRRPDRRRERVPVGSGRACGKAGPRPTGAGRGFTGGERQRAVSAWLGPVAGGCRRAGRRASSSGGGIRGRDGWIAVAGRARRRLPRATLTAGGFGPEWSPPTRPDACLARPPDSRRSRSLSAVPS